MTSTLAARLIIALIALVAALPADALRLNPDGSGEAVLVPYYTVRDGRQTLFSVVNHSDRAKAVRLAFAEGRNGRPVLTFNVYLAPRDTWTGALSPDPAGARLRSIDNTCTVPTLPNDGVQLRNFAYTGSNIDGYGSEPERLAEGQLEAIEMGELSASATALATQCSALIGRFVGTGIWTQTPNADIEAPTGQLSVDAQIVDVTAGVIFDVPSIALEDFSGPARHATPGDANALRFIRPTLNPNQTDFVVDGFAHISADRPADAVSLVLMAASLEGQFSVEPALAATTDWIVAFPTRQAYLDNLPGGELGDGTARRAPFAVGSTSPQRCNAVTWETIARNGTIAGLNDPFPAPVSTSLCAQITKIEVTRNLPTSESANPLSTYGEVSGRLRLGLRTDLHSLGYLGGPSGTHAGTLQGLPVLALPLIEARNAAAQPGLLATYGYSGQVVRKQTGSIDF